MTGGAGGSQDYSYEGESKGFFSPPDQKTYLVSF